MEQKARVITEPCPFCGKRSSLLVDKDEVGFYYVWCSPFDYGCGTTGPGALSREEAIDSWNERAAVPVTMKTMKL